MKFDNWDDVPLDEEPEHHSHRFVLRAAPDGRWGVIRRIDQTWVEPPEYDQSTAEKLSGMACRGYAAGFRDGVVAHWREQRAEAEADEGAPERKRRRKTSRHD